MMRSTLGAPLGGTMVAGQYGVESLAVSLMTPPNGSGGAGSCLPGMGVEALGGPGVPVDSWAGAGRAANVAAPAVRRKNSLVVTNLERPPALATSVGLS